MTFEGWEREFTVKAEMGMGFEFWLGVLVRCLGYRNKMRLNEISSE